MNLFILNTDPHYKSKLGLAKPPVVSLLTLSCEHRVRATRYNGILTLIIILRFVKIKICQHIYLVTKAWDLLICVCDSVTIYFVQNIILTGWVIFPRRAWLYFLFLNTDSTLFSSYLLTLSTFLKRWLCDKSGRSYPFYSVGPCLRKISMSDWHIYFGALR